MSDSTPKDTPSAPGGPSTDVGSLLQRFDEEVSKTPSKTLERFWFGFGGLNFEVRRIKQDEKYLFLVNADIGYIPFSIESNERREALKTILRASQVLHKVCFDVDASNKISARALFEAPENISADYIFYPLTIFMQEARPYIEPRPSHRLRQKKIPRNRPLAKAVSFFLVNVV
jgi:hypothetical protein